ncbi:MAG: zinc-dependent metalloprotease [Chitinophagaceae bacterium]|nr:zinc-dependent metalloprotease [Chitinophagaceae bacterium]MCB9047005.1 T9SS type A sorting domain-containing protein [Chitinophagales bacterium]
MIRKITLLFLSCIGILGASYAQPRCGFDGAHQQMMSQDPSYAQHVAQFNSQLAQWLSTNNNMNSLLTTNSAGDTIYEVPLVVHVMHTGGSIGSNYNISDAQIINTVDYVNQTFAATWSGYAPVGSGGTKFPFRFKLAQRAPNCTATSGIVRVNASATYSNYTTDGVNRSSSGGVSDPALKALSVWPNDRYYNIWVVNKIDGVDGYPGTSGSFVAGYAYFPGASAGVDGTIMLASQMNTGKTTLPHELGHAFFLYHTFEASNPSTNTCPTNTNCATQGDRCCDTEPHYQYGPGTCYSGQSNACTSTTFGDATAKNIMNYANCTDRFTPDQRDRFIGAIINDRSTLISSSASLPLPTTSLPSVCVPGITNSSNNRQSGPREVSITDASPGTRVYMDVQGDGYGDYNADGNISYRDYTCQHRVSLVAGKSYTLTIRSNFNDKGAAFIDYNNDGILGNSSGERLAIQDLSGGSVHTVTFTVPYTATSCTPIRMRVISDNTSGYIDSCSNRLYGQTEDYEVLIYGTSSSTASVSIGNPPTGGNPSCYGTTLTFHASPSSGTTVIGYQWFINHTLLSGQTNDSLMSNIFNDKDTVMVQMYYANLCGVDTVSDSIVVERRTTIAPAVTIGVTGGTNPTCIDDTVTLSVVSNVNPGGSPTYQWMSNGTNITGATGPTFRAYARGGETITVRMESSASSPCSDPGYAISNGIQIQYTTKTPVANIALTIGTNPGCAGQALQFTVTPTTGGTAPTYQWTVNGNPVVGATGVNFNTSTLKHNDQVRVIMTSNSPCASPTTVTSAPIAVIHEKITADITIAQTTGTNPACQGKPLIFSANTSNAGKNPTFQWLVDGIAINTATSPIYVTDSLRNNQRVQCVLIATDSCVANPHDTSNFITMLITPSKRPTVSIAVTTGKNPGCLDSLIELTATATDLGTAPDYAWIINGFQATTGNVFSSSSMQNGNILMVRANQTDNGCYLPDTVYSQPFIMVRSTTPKAPVISLIGNMIHTNFDSSFVWFGPKGQDTVNFKNTTYPDTIGAYWAVTNNNGCWSPPSNILRITLLDITGIDLNGMEVYPNPTSDKVVLDWHGKSVSYRIDILNSIGQVVLRDQVTGVSKKELSLGSMPAGNYFLLLKDAEGKVGTFKVTVGNK